MIKKCTFQELENKYAPHPHWFIPIIQKILNSKLETPFDVPFVFEPTKAAEAHNASILKDHFYDIRNFINKNEKSAMKYWSEFKDPATLSDLLYLYPLYREICDSLTTGLKFPINPVSEEKRKNDL